MYKGLKVVAFCFVARLVHLDGQATACQAGLIKENLPLATLHTGTMHEDIFGHRKSTISGPFL